MLSAGRFSNIVSAIDLSVISLPETGLAGVFFLKGGMNVGFFFQEMGDLFDCCVGGSILKIFFPGCYFVWLKPVIWKYVTVEWIYARFPEGADDIALRKGLHVCTASNPTNIIMGDLMTNMFT